MARSSTSKHAAVVTFFSTAPIAVANTVFDIVRATMKARNTPTTVAPKPRKKAARKARVPKASGSSEPAAAPVASEPVAVAVE